MDESPAIPPPANVPLAEPSVRRMTFRSAGSRTWVRIEAAATHASVFVNGRRVGEHLGAWTAFEFDVTGFLRGENEENELEIRCEDRVHTTNGFLPTIGVRWTGVREVAVRGGPTPLMQTAAQRSSSRGTRLL